MKLVEDKLEREYKQSIPALIKTASEIQKIAHSIPPEWDNDKDQQTYIAYLFKDVAKADLIDELPIKKEYMEILYRHECLIWNIKRANYNKSHITKIATHESYGRMTTRNAHTARKLAELCKNK